MAEKRTYFLFTTASQRHLLFETWKATGDVGVACQRAHVGRRIFYYWKLRFLRGSFAALGQCASRAAKHPPRVAPNSRATSRGEPARPSRVGEAAPGGRTHENEHVGATGQPEDGQTNPLRRRPLDRAAAAVEKRGRRA